MKRSAVDSAFFGERGQEVADPIGAFRQWRHFQVEMSVSSNSVCFCMLL